MPKLRMPFPAPSYLSPAAKREWARMVTAMPARMLRGIDRMAFACYCQDYGRWAEAQQKITETGLLVKTATGAAIANPWLAISDRARDGMMNFLRSYGMAPSCHPATIRIFRDNEWSVALASIGIMTTVGPSKIAAVLKTHIDAVVSARLKHRGRGTAEPLR